METGELADAEPRGLSVNCGLRHFIRMPLSRAAMQPSCRGVPEQVCTESSRQAAKHIESGGLVTF